MDSGMSDVALGAPDGFTDTNLDAVANTADDSGALDAAATQDAGEIELDAGADTGGADAGTPDAGVSCGNVLSQNEVWALFPTNRGEVDLAEMSAEWSERLCEAPDECSEWVDIGSLLHGREFEGTARLESFFDPVSERHLRVGQRMAGRYTGNYVCEVQGDASWNLPLPNGGIGSGGFLRCTVRAIDATTVVDGTLRGRATLREHCISVEGTIRETRDGVPGRELRLRLFGTY